MKYLPNVLYQIINFRFDDNISRYKSVISGECPVVLHFPGKNWRAMRNFYNTQFKTSSTTPNDDSFSIVIITILFVVIIFMMLVLISHR